MDRMDFNELVGKVGRHVTQLLEERLAVNLYFHNGKHTAQVVAAAQEIGVESGLNEEELQVVIIAAWFHDVGYTLTYKGHEEFSVEMAESFLNKLNVDTFFIKQVTSCILATEYPQKPRNLMERVICDADFYHFSKIDYIKFEQSLRLEWEFYFNRIYTDAEWNKMNFEMLSLHSYFTYYGQRSLQVGKEKQLKRLSSQLP